MYYIPLNEYAKIQTFFELAKLIIGMVLLLLLVERPDKGEVVQRPMQ